MGPPWGPLGPSLENPPGLNPSCGAPFVRPPMKFFFRGPFWGPLYRGPLLGAPIETAQRPPGDPHRGAPIERVLPLLKVFHGGPLCGGPSWGAPSETFFRGPLSAFSIEGFGALLMRVRLFKGAPRCLIKGAPGAFFMGAPSCGSSGCL